MSCAHTDVVLSDPLEQPIAAALRLRIDEARGIDQALIARQITWAVRASGTITRKYHAPAAASAAMRLHDDLAPLGNPPMKIKCRLCQWAEKYWEHPPDRTEMGLGERTAALHSGNLAWNTSGTYMVWDDARYRTDETAAAATALIKGVVRDLLPAEASDAQAIADYRASNGPADDPEVERAAKDAAQAHAYQLVCQRLRVVKAGLEFVRSEPGITVPAENWDADPALLNVANGTIELTRAGAKLREHRQEDRLTRITRAADRPAADTSEWGRFVRAVLPDPAVCDRAQRLAGYSLFGGNLERLLVMLLGPTTTGKSTFVETIAHVLGDYGGPFELSMFRGTRDGGAHRADLVAALPRRFIQTTEASDRWQLHADAIKRITGGDTLAPRGAYARAAIEERPAFVPWIATNTAPQVVGADDALWRRLEVLPFTTKITREDSDLGLRLRTEHADGVLRWLVEGWEQYARLGLGPLPTACAVAAAQVRRDMSLVDTWLSECADADPESEIAGHLVGSSWQAWCADNHVPQAERISDVALGRELTARGFPSRHSRGKSDRHRVRVGLRLIDEHTPGLRVVE